MTCQWTVMIGDSNNRNAFDELEMLEHKLANLTQHSTSNTQRRLVLRAPATVDATSTSSSSSDQCDERWADREMVILTTTDDDQNNNQDGNSDACHIVSLKFSKDQDTSIQRLMNNNNLHTASYCMNGKEITTTTSHDHQLYTSPSSSSSSSSHQWQRPDQPDLIWFSTGFWNLHQQTQDNCDQRFHLVLQALNHWRSQGIRVVWQSLFPINEHPHITNAMIQWDYRCQKQLASKHRIEVADLYTAITQAGYRKIVNNYHLNAGRYEQYFVQPILDVCCGGWEQYLGQAAAPPEPEAPLAQQRNAVAFEGRCQRFVDKVLQAKWKTTNQSTRSTARTCCDEMYKCLQD